MESNILFVPPWHIGPYVMAWYTKILSQSKNAFETAALTFRCQSERKFVGFKFEEKIKLQRPHSSVLCLSVPCIATKVDGAAIKTNENRLLQDK